MFAENPQVARPGDRVRRRFSRSGVVDLRRRAALKVVQQRVDVLGREANAVEGVLGSWKDTFSPTAETVKVADKRAAKPAAKPKAATKPAAKKTTATKKAPAKATSTPKATS